MGNKVGNREGWKTGKEKKKKDKRELNNNLVWWGFL